MTTEAKKTTAYILSGVGLAASIGGIFYAAKKGYGGWGKFGMFILFGAPFQIASGAFSMSATPKASLQQPPMSASEYAAKVAAEMNANNK